AVSGWDVRPVMGPPLDAVRTSHRPERRAAWIWRGAQEARAARGSAKWRGPGSGQCPLVSPFTLVILRSSSSDGGVATRSHDSRRQLPSTARFAKAAATESITRTG